VLGVFNDADSLIGIAPWYVERSVVHGRVLRPLGSGEVCSDYLSVLCHPAMKEAVVEALAEHLVQSAREDGPHALRWDLLELDGVDAEDHLMAGLLGALAFSGCTIYRRPSLSCWRLELPTNWDCYVASLGKHQRHTVRRLERKVVHTDRVVLHAPTRLDELSPAMDILIDLHQRRRQMLGEKGCFASARFLGFYRDVVPELLRRGQVQLYWLELDGKPAAAEYHLQGDGVLYVYQAGVNPEMMEDQPGNVINLMILRWAIERGYRAYDFLRGDEVYKARFGAQPRPTLGWRVVPPRAAAQFRHNLWLAGNNVKQWIKRRVKPGAPAAKETIT
jgi:CelD/BcsL family acetyltransferase involved in cellulose biosynthesis